MYERKPAFDDRHGAKKFSLIYIGGEGVATYQALYWSNKKYPKALAIIQPGTGFGLNWTDFTKESKELAWVVLNNKYGVPEIILYGGIGTNYMDFSWSGYQYIRTINPYYSSYYLPPSQKPYGEVTIWKRVREKDDY